MRKTVIGGGCFWCIQAVFLRLKGVQSVKSGYTAGKTLNPTYKEVCSGQTGHAEVCMISYNPNILPYKGNYLFIQLSLTYSQKIHDPTTLNRQGHDEGTQYRSIILYENEEEKKTAIESIKQLQAEKYYKDKIVTQVVKLEVFYPAQQYHDNYYNLNTEQGYCRAVIKPKLGKLAEYFKDYVDKSKL